MTSAVPERCSDASVSEDGMAWRPDEARGRRVSYDEPGVLVVLLDRKIENGDVFFRLLQFLNMKAAGPGPAA